MPHGKQLSISTLMIKPIPHYGAELFESRWWAGADTQHKILGTD